MTEKDFWKLIDASRKASDSDLEEFVDELRQRLAALPPERILAFDQQLGALLQRAYDWGLWGAAYIINGGSSDDGFLYFRAWLVAQGRAVYEKALANPESLADVAEPDSAELEDLLGVAGEAYEEATGEELPERAPTESGEPRGQPWKEEALKERFPLLSERFG